MSEEKKKHTKTTLILLCVTFFILGVFTESLGVTESVLSKVFPKNSIDLKNVDRTETVLLVSPKVSAEHTDVINIFEKAIKANSYILPKHNSGSYIHTLASGKTFLFPQKYAITRKDDTLQYVFYIEKSADKNGLVLSAYVLQRGKLLLRPQSYFFSQEEHNEEHIVNVINNTVQKLQRSSRSIVK